MLENIADGRAGGRSPQRGLAAGGRAGGEEIVAGGAPRVDKLGEAQKVLKDHLVRVRRGRMKPGRTSHGRIQPAREPFSKS